MPARLHLPAARRAVVALGVVGALAVSATPAAAEPAPATSREAADLIAARARDLEVLTENFNEARERLKATERAAPGPPTNSRRPGPRWPAPATGSAWWRAAPTPATGSTPCRRC